VHVDAILTNLSVAYMQSLDSFIATRVFPMLPVDKQTNKYYTYPRDDWFRDEAKLRAPSTESAGGGYTLSTDSYSCKVYAIHKDVENQTLRNADSSINMFRDATEWVTRQLLQRLEVDWMTKYFATGIWGTDVTGAVDFTVWSDQALSDPIGDIGTGLETVLKNTGYLPNKLVLGYQTYRQLKNHPDIISRVSAGGSSSRPATVNERALAEVLDLDEVIVSKSVRVTTEENAASDTYAFNAGKHAFLCYAAPNPGVLQPSAGYTFGWRGISSGLGASTAISRFAIPTLKSERVEGESAWDHKVVSSALGYFFSGAVA